MTPAAGRRTVRVQVLGRFSLRGAGGQGVPTARKPRQVLAVLVLNAGRPVPTGTLVSELWDDQPPRSASTTLQTYVFQLRKSLAMAYRVSPDEIARRVLTTQYGGYRLSAAGIRSDLDAFGALEQRARGAETAGDHDAAAAALRAPLAIGDGPLLSDVQHGRVLHAEAERFRARRLALVLRCISGDLRLGLHRDAVSELAALSVRHPCHEEVHALLMTALHGCGRRSDALEAFARLRTAMDSGLGVAPGPVVRRLYRAIQSGDEVAPDAASISQAGFETGPPDSAQADGSVAVPATLSSLRGGFPQ
jgi:DNA-binding SARP family transcriptional activator